MSTVEIIPTELFVEIFQYLSTVDLLHAFLDLNYRLNQLIHLSLQNRPVSLQSIDKQDFDRICHEHRSILPTNITSLHLSSDDETIELCALFLTTGLNLNRFIHLQSLTLSYIEYYQTLNQLICQCHHLSSLHKLDLINCQCISQQRNDTVILIQNIWRLPNLIHCVINNINVNMTWITQVSVICQTLEYLSIGMIDGDKSALYHLCKSLPNIQRLHIDVIQWSFYSQPKIRFLDLIELKTTFRGSIEPTMEFLRDLPNLTSLTLEISDEILTGDDWQNLLENSLPNLKIFRLKMNFSLNLNTNLITITDQIVDSYRTPFWIKDHQWYIRYDCYLGHNEYRIVLYTIPYAFTQCSYLNTYYSISTKPDDDQRYSHEQVQRVDQRSILIDSMQNFRFFHIRFPNVYHVDIHFPWIDHSSLFRHLSYEQLRSLTVTLTDASSYEQLQILLHHTPRLYSFKLISFRSIERFFQLTSSSIRRLDLNFAFIKHGLMWNHENCLNLIQSPLGHQCEVLILQLDSQNDILELIEKIPHLRVLIFQMKTDNSFRLKSRKLIPWLKTNLPSKCSITTNSEQQPKISIWINREFHHSLPSNAQTSISTDPKEHSSKPYVYLFFFVVVFLLCVVFYYHFIISN